MYAVFMHGLIKSLLGEFLLSLVLSICAGVLVGAKQVVEFMLVLIKAFLRRNTTLNNRLHRRKRLISNYS